MKYSKEDRAAVIAFLYASGFPHRRGAIKYTEYKTGVHHKQVRQWSDRIDHFVGLENLEKKMIDLKQVVETELEGIFKEMENKRESASYRDLVTGAGVLADKLIVLEGGTNSRNETIIKDWRQAVLEARNGIPNESK